MFRVFLGRVSIREVARWDGKIQKLPKNDIFYIFLQKSLFLPSQPLALHQVIPHVLISDAHRRTIISYCASIRVPGKPLHSFHRCFSTPSQAPRDDILYISPFSYHVTGRNMWNEYQATAVRARPNSIKNFAISRESNVRVLCTALLKEWNIVEEKKESILYYYDTCIAMNKIFYPSFYPPKPFKELEKVTGKKIKNYDAWALLVFFFLIFPYNLLRWTGLYDRWSCLALFLGGFLAPKACHFFSSLLYSSMMGQRKLWLYAKVSLPQWYFPVHRTCTQKGCLPSAWYPKGDTLSGTLAIWFDWNYICLTPKVLGKVPNTVPIRVLEVLT